MPGNKWSHGLDHSGSTESIDPPSGNFLDPKHVIEMDILSGWHNYQDESYHSRESQVAASKIAPPPRNTKDDSKQKIKSNLRGNGRN